jgi:hypothetical protein
VSTVVASTSEAVIDLLLLASGRSGRRLITPQGHNRSPFVEEEIVMETFNSSGARRVPWNKGRLTRPNPPLKLREIWAIRTRLQMSTASSERAI